MNPPSAYVTRRSSPSFWPRRKLGLCALTEGLQPLTFVPAEIAANVQVNAVTAHRLVELSVIQLKQRSKLLHQPQQALPADNRRTHTRLPDAPCTMTNRLEGIWANMKNGLGNLAARDVDELAAIIKNRLKRIQYRPALIDGFLAQTGLTHEPQPP